MKACTHLNLKREEVCMRAHTLVPFIELCISSTTQSAIVSKSSSGNLGVADGGLSALLQSVVIKAWPSKLRALFEAPIALAESGGRTTQHYGSL